MSNTKKPLAVLSMSAIAGLLAVAVTTPVSANATAIVVNGKDAKAYEYSYSDLKTSAAAAIVSGTTDSGATLYNDFLTRKNTIKAYYDDVHKAYVDFAVVSAAATTDILDGKTFDFKGFLEKTTTPTVSLTPDKVAVVDGKINVSPVVTKLAVNSVDAISKTQVKVTFNQAVDAVTKDNFAVDGGVAVTNAQLSADRTSAVLDLSGAKWATSYNVTVTNVLVNGTKADTVTGTFKSVDVTSAYDLKIVPKDSTITASTGDNTVLTFQLLDKTTGLVDKNANNIVLSISTTYGTLANTKLTVQNGQATVLLTGEYNVNTITSKIDAQIIEASGDYKDLIGKVTGTLNLNFVPAGTQTPDTKEAPILVSAAANQADRVVLYFNKDINVDDLVEKDPATGKYLVDPSGNATLTTGTAIKIANKSDYSDARTIRGIRSVAGNTRAVEVILAKASSITDNTIDLTDNSTVYVKANVGAAGNTQQTNFILTDARRPEPVSVGVSGLKTVNVNYSESIVAPKTTQVLVDAGKAVVITATVGDFDQVTGTDTRNVLTVTTKDYMISGDHSIQLAGISDYAGITDANNICTTQTLGFNVAENTLAPTATVTVESPEQYRVKFNTAVAYTTGGVIQEDLSQVPNLFKLQRYNSTTGKYDIDATTTAPTGTGTIAQGLVVTKVSDSEYVVEVNKDWTQVYNTTTTNKNYYNDKYQLELATAGTQDPTTKLYTDGLVNPANGKAIQANLDLSLNYTGSAMNSNDTVSPVITSIQRVNTTNNFDVIMSKPVKINANSIADNATNTPSLLQGTTIPTTIVEFQGKDKDGNIVTLTGNLNGYSFIGTDNKMDDTTFNVTLTGIQGLVDNSGYDTNWTLIVRSISDDVGNTAATLTKDFKVEKSIAAAGSFRVLDGDSDKTNGVDGIKVTLINNAPGTTTDVSDTIAVTFTEGVKYIGTNDNATNVANYTLNGDPLPKGASIQLAPDSVDPTKKDDKTIIITLPDKTLSNATHNTLVLNKALVAGNGDILTWEHEFVLPDAAPVAVGITGAATEVTAGAALSPAVQGVYDVTPATANTFTIDTAPDLQYAASTTTGKWSNLTELVALINNDATLKAKYTATVAPNGTDVRLTQVAGQESATAPVITGNDAALAGTVTAGSATKPGTPEVNKLTVSGTVGAAGTVEVTFNDGVNPAVTQTINVAATDTTATIAQKIVTAFNALAGYTVTANASDVVFTASAAAADTNVTITLK